MKITKEEVSEILHIVNEIRAKKEEDTDIEVSTFLLGIFLFRDIYWRKEDVDT